MRRRAVASTTMIEWLRMISIAILSPRDNGYSLLPLTIDEQSLRVANGRTEEVKSTDEIENRFPAIVLATALNPRSLGIPANRALMHREVRFLAGGSSTQAELTALPPEKAPERYAPLRVDLAPTEELLREDDELMRMVDATLRLLARVVALSPPVRRSLQVLAEELEMPGELFGFEEEAMLRDSALTPEQLRSEIPQRPHVRRDSAWLAELKLPPLEEVFSSIREERLPEADFEYRPEQEEFAREVERALAEEKHLLMEAGTGVGKSIGYLLPALRHATARGEPVIVSTNTKVLQDQLLHSDFPRLEVLFGKRLPPPVVLKGRENYVCLEKLRLHLLSSRTTIRELFSELAETGADQRTVALALLGLALSVFASESGEFEHLPAPSDLPERSLRMLRQRLNCAFRGCLREHCPLLRECFFYAQREAADHSPLSIVNHALLFSLAHPEADPDDPMTSFVDRAPVLILDEAHNLEEVLLNALAVELNSLDYVEFLNGLSRLFENRLLLGRLALPVDEVPTELRDAFLRLKELQAQVPAVGEELYEVFRELTARLDDAFREFREVDEEWVQVDLTDPMREEVRKLREEITELISRVYDLLLELNSGLTLLAERTSTGEEGSFFYLADNRYQIALREVANRFSEMKQACAGLLSEAPEWVKWVEIRRAFGREGGMWEVAACPVVVGGYFAQLIDGRRSAIMTSGTLAVRESFNFVKKNLGLNELPPERMGERILASPFDYQRRALVLVPRDVPEPNFRDRQAHDDFLKALSEVVLAASRAFAGNTLVLFNSYSDLRRVAELAEEPLQAEGLTLLRQVRGSSRFRLAADFRRIEGAVLLGVRSFWEGFDIRGEDLQCVIISRLPFPNVKDPVVAGKIRYLDGAGVNSFTEFMLPAAMMKFKQGFGRLIRSRNDFGTVLVLDRRVLTKRYGEAFLECLPGPTVRVVARDEVENELINFLSKLGRSA